MNRPTPLFALAIALMLSILCSACTRTAPTKFYLLSPLAAEQPPSQQSQTTTANLTLILSPIELPAYLDRPQLVTRNSIHEIRLSDLHKWAEPLETQVKVTIKENLAALRPDLLLSTHANYHPTAQAIQLAVNVLRFDGQPGQETVLVARWSLTHPSAIQPYLNQTSVYREAVPQNDFPSLVAAQSRLLERLCRDIARAIQPLPQPQ